MLKILYLTDADLAPYKAPRIHVSQFLKHWHQAGCDVLLRAPRTCEVMPDFDFPYVWLPRSNLRLWGDWLLQRRLCRQLKQELRRHRWDVVYTRQISTAPQLYRLCRTFGVPVLCEVNGFLLENYETGGAPAWKLRIVERMEATIMQHSSLVVVPYQALKERMVEHYDLPDGKVIVVENGVDPALFRPMNKQHCRMSLGLRQDAVYVGYVGSFDFYHDVETMLHAYQAIASSLEYDVYFLLVGDGERKGEMQALSKTLGIEHRVQFVGAVQHADVPRYINACDVMLALQPKARLQEMGEAGALKTREYLACEVPVVQSHVVGMPYPFADDACAYIEPESVDALVDAVVGIVQGDITLSSIRDDIIAHGSWAFAAGKVLAAMKALVEGKSG